MSSPISPSTSAIQAKAVAMAAAKLADQRAEADPDGGEGSVAGDTDGGVDSELGGDHAAAAWGWPGRHR
jgi:hypothetical protein